MKLLIVEDHDVNRRLLRAQLEAAGVQVLEAANGALALERLRVVPVDGVVSDILMPEMDGYRLCLELRKDRRLRDLPFVLYTSTYNSPADRHLADRVGADAYISKPAPAEAIIETLRAAARNPARPAAKRVPESDVLKQYNEALVRKLEDRNLALEASLQELQRAEARYRLVFENVPSGITMTAADGTVLSANPAMAQMLGYASVEEGLKELRDSAHGAYLDAQRRAEYIALLKRDGAVRKFEAQLRHKRGRHVWVSLSGRIISDPRAQGTLLVTMAVDITREKEQQERIARLSRIRDMLGAVSSAIVRLRQRQALYEEACRIAVEYGGFGFAFIGLPEPGSASVRPVAWCAAGGAMPADLANTSPAQRPGVGARALHTRQPVVENDLGVEADLNPLRRWAVARGFRSAIALPLSVQGEAVAAFVLYADLPGVFDDEQVGLLEGLAGDVSLALEYLAKSDRLEYLAYYDLLTGLPNRALFHDRLAHGLHARAGDLVLIAVVLLDLQGFRRVNDTLGRQAGDELLRAVGARLLQANDAVARLGGDVFALILRSTRGAADVSRALEALLRAAFGAPHHLRGQELRIAGRAGVALFPADGRDPDALLRNAEAALRLAKRNGEQLVFYAPEMNARVAEALATETKLRRALERGEFVLHYQPKVGIAGGRIVGAEALIRWQDPEKGLVPPGQFIPILEETGMIAEVGNWAVGQALFDHAAWAAQGQRLPHVAVNVSAVQLQRKDFVDAVITAVQRCGDNPEALQLEITESLLMRDVEASIRKLSILRGMGIQVAMDDFGTGYSSLSYIARLPLDTVKIDRAFISGAPGNAEDAAIVAGIVALVHSLKLKVVAEGVETEEQVRYLSGLGCDEAQGYHYCRPVPADRLLELLRAGGALPAAARAGV